MADIEFAPGKRARTAYSFDDLSIVPSRRTREPDEVSINPPSVLILKANLFDASKPK